MRSHYHLRLLAVALLCSTASAAAELATIQEKVDIAISPEQSNEDRVKAANELTEKWQDSIPVLTEKIEAFHQSLDAGGDTKDATGKLVPLTDLLVTIVGNKEGSAQKFREADSGKTIDVLTDAAGGGVRSLRFNASNILIRVVDDDNFCVVLHRLRDPKLGYSGQVNLLQVAIIAANKASRENLIAAKQAAELLKPSTDRKIAQLATLLDELATSRLSSALSLPADSYCIHYNVETGSTANTTDPTPTPPPQ